MESVIDQLDFRERGGYTRKSVLFYPLSPSHSSDTNITSSHTEEKPFYLSIYIGEEDNPNFAGHEDIDTIAKHIVDCAGASGPNKEYLYNLATAMRAIAPGVNDDHLFNLEDTVRQLEIKRERELLHIKHCNCNNININ